MLARLTSPPEHGYFYQFNMFGRPKSFGLGRLSQREMEQLELAAKHDEAILQANEYAHERLESELATQRSELSARKDALLVELGEVSESLEALYVSHANLRATREGLAEGVRDALGAAAEEVLRRVEPPD